MSIDEIPEQPMPLWVKIIMIVSCLPLLALPRLISLCSGSPSDERLLWLYPIDVLLSVACAWRCWGRRRELSWIIIGILWLTHLAIWLIADPSILL